MTPTTTDDATETPIFDALLTEHEESLPLIHLSSALRRPSRAAHGPSSRNAGPDPLALGIEPKLVPSAEVPVLPRRRAH